MEDIARRGFGETGDQAVCGDHLLDPGLLRQVEPYFSKHECTFCGRSADPTSDPIAASFDDFMGVVMDAVSFFFGHANDEGVMREDGDWVGAPIYDSFDVLEEVCAFDVDDDVLEAMRRIVLPEDWTDRNFELQRPDRAMRAGWQDFRDKVKYESRFVFLAVPEESSFMPDEFTSMEFLERLVEIAVSTDALATIPAGRTFWRGRLVSESRKPEYRAAALGSPPRDKASANRMSPAGISVFYGSDDVDTVVAEIGAHSTRRFAAVGAFSTTRQLTMLDLAGLPPIPSVYGRVDRRQYYDLQFLHGFATDLRAPVELDGREHIEYVPTQVVTEYLRWIPEVRIDGIMFRSAQGAGTSCVIFCDARGCADPGDQTDSTYLRYDPDSLHVVRVVTRPEPVGP